MSICHLVGLIADYNCRSDLSGVLCTGLFSRPSRDDTYLQLHFHCAGGWGKSFNFIVSLTLRASNELNETRTCGF